MKYIDKEILQNAVNKSKTKTECITELGMHPTSNNSYRILNYYISVHRIDISHFDANQIKNKYLKKMDATPLKDIFDGKHPLYKISRLRLRLLKEGYFDHVCSSCKNHEWMGEPIPLELDHIDGCPTNHSLDNLRLLCPNCHAKTKNYCAKNKTISIENKIKRDKILENKSKKKEKYDLRKYAIMVSGIDFSKFGWVKKVADLLGMQHSKVCPWMIRYMPDFYENHCYKRKKPSY